MDLGRTRAQPGIATPSAAPFSQQSPANAAHIRLICLPDRPHSDQIGVIDNQTEMTVKGILIALGLATALTSAAQAGDLHKQRSVKDEPVTMGRVADLPEPVKEDYRWSGLTVAGLGGYSIGTASESGQDFGLSAEGGLIEGQLGYRQQMGQFVGGIYGCASYSAISHFKEGYCAAATLGFLLDPKTLVSAEGGWRWQTIDLGSDTLTASGPFAGLSLEHKITQAISLKASAQHMWVNDTDKIDIPSDINVGDNRVLLGVVFQIGQF